MTDTLILTPSLLAQFRQSGIYTPGFGEAFMQALADAAEKGLHLPEVQEDADFRQSAAFENGAQSTGASVRVDVIERLKHDLSTPDCYAQRTASEREAYRIWVELKPVFERLAAVEQERDEARTAAHHLAALQEDFPAALAGECDKCQACGTLVMCSEHSFLSALHRHTATWDNIEQDALRRRAERAESSLAAEREAHDIYSKGQQLILDKLNQVTASLQRAQAVVEAARDFMLANQTEQDHIHDVWTGNRSTYSALRSALDAYDASAVRESRKE